MAPDLRTKSVVETSRLFAETGSVIGGDPMEWSAEQFHRWLLTAEGRPLLARRRARGATEARRLLGMNGAALGALFAGAGREGRPNEGRACGRSRPRAAGASRRRRWRRCGGRAPLADRVWCLGAEDGG